MGNSLSSVVSASVERAKKLFVWNRVSDWSTRDFLRLYLGLSKKKREEDEMEKIKNSSPFLKLQLAKDPAVITQRDMASKVLQFFGIREKTMLFALTKENIRVVLLEEKSDIISSEFFYTHEYFTTITKELLRSGKTKHVGVLTNFRHSNHNDFNNVLLQFYRGCRKQGRWAKVLKNSPVTRLMELCGSFGYFPWNSKFFLIVLEVENMVILQKAGGVIYDGTLAKHLNHKLLRFERPWKLMSPEVDEYISVYEYHSKFDRRPGEDSVMEVVEDMEYHMKVAGKNTKDLKHEILDKIKARREEEYSPSHESQGGMTSELVSYKDGLVKIR